MKLLLFVQKSPGLVGTGVTCSLRWRWWFYTVVVTSHDDIANNECLIHFSVSLCDLLSRGRLLLYVPVVGFPLPPMYDVRPQPRSLEKALCYITSDIKSQAPSFIPFLPPSFYPSLYPPPSPHTCVICLYHSQHLPFHLVSHSSLLTSQNLWSHKCESGPDNSIIIQTKTVLSPFFLYVGNQLIKNIKQIG